jgi:hypothetical protein
MVLLDSTKQHLCIFTLGPHDFVWFSPAGRSSVYAFLHLIRRFCMVLLDWTTQHLYGLHLIRMILHGLAKLDATESMHFYF